MTEADAGQPADETPDAVSRARQLLQGGKLKAALALAKAELLDNPENTEALYIQAVAHRYLGQSGPGPGVAWKNSKTQAPAYARAYQEEGHNLKQLGQLAARHWLPISGPSTSTTP